MAALSSMYNRSLLQSRAAPLGYYECTPQHLRSARLPSSTAHLLLHCRRMPLQIDSCLRPLAALQTVRRCHNQCQGAHHAREGTCPPTLPLSSQKLPDETSSDVHAHVYRMRMCMMINDYQSTCTCVSLGPITLTLTPTLLLTIALGCFQAWGKGPASSGGKRLPAGSSYLPSGK